MYRFSSGQFVDIADASYGATQTRIDTEVNDAVTTINVHAAAGPSVHSYTLSAGTLRALGENDASTRTAWMEPGNNNIERAHLNDLNGNSPFSQAETFYADQSGFISDRISLMRVTAGSADLYVTSVSGLSGLYTLEHSGDSLRTLDRMRDSDDQYAGNIVDMASATVNGTTYIVAASQMIEHGVSSYRLAQNGDLAHIDSLGANEGIGMGNPTCITTTQVNGQAYALTGSALTGSISVMQIEASGHLSLTAHITDDRNTRFGGISVLETVTINDKAFVVAGGADDGLSLFLLTPDGNLIHLDTIEDTTSIGLMNVSGLTLQAGERSIDVFVTSATDGGLSHFTIDIPSGITGTGSTGDDTLNGSNGQDILSGRRGDDQLSGGNGDDMLIGGHGSDTMSGGSGRDIFVVEESDEITDFEPLVDRLDFTAWDGLYSIDQLEIASHRRGAVLSYGDETLRLTTSDGSRLSTSDFYYADILGLYQPVDPPSISGVGTSGNDTIIGTDFEDELTGNNGDDELLGGGGRDTLIGGGGNDTLMGEASHDELIGDQGDDYLNGGFGDDRLYGGSGADTLLGDTATDYLEGGSGEDSLTGGTGADTLMGGDDDDRLFSNTGIDVVYGEDGNDYISSGDGVDSIYGGNGNDTLYGRSGWDVIEGNAGNDRIYGSSGDDRLFGNEGEDWISGGSAWDFLDGGAGNDTLYGNFGSDLILGGEGQDILYGGTGDDSLTGGAGNDTLFGNQGVDVLRGGLGDDELRGGTLRDTFIFSENNGSDVITDFEARQDELWLSTELTRNVVTPSEIIEQYGEIRSGVAVLDFGSGNQITFEGIDDLYFLLDNIDIF